ncbi:ABC transporter substrate-binding protein [Candidatus Poriferisocius sp.]|uniref:ABC transporter substrate-binding protein n=1 Tax=Candidatus Poriferisocius sp. TaxID=3101276 RepID=UPI003B01D2C3
MPGERRPLRNVLGPLLAVFCALALVASACGGGNDDDGGDTVVGTTQPTPAGSGDAGSGDGGGSGDAGDGDGGSGDDDVSSGDAGSGDDNGSEAGSSSGSDGGASDGTAGESPVLAEPVYGGTMVFGLEAETTNGLNPVNAQAAVSGHILFRALYETLTIEGTGGEALPLLLESFTPNDDFTEWVLTLRPGITFHDGSPADAAALKRHFEELQKGTLTGIAMGDLDIDTIEEVDGLSVRLILNRPQATLPNYLTSHLGYFGAPSMYDLGAEGSARNPIGTGPFMLDEWIPNEITRMVRNPNYWRTDAQGRQLPYLDAIEFRPIPDTDGRFAALRAGDLDASSVNTGLRIDDYNEQFKTFWEPDQYSEPSYLMLNNSVPPLDNVEFRRALAQCTDRQTFNDLRWDGQVPATGPFAPGTPGYLEDAGFPAHDPDAGRATISRLGVTGVEIGTTNDSSNLFSTELIASMWGDCGLDVSITQVDQAELITNAVVGRFTAFLWRNHPSYDLTAERIWWHSRFGQGIALNFGRINNPRVDAALDEARETSDLDRRRELAEEVNRAFAEEVNNIWFYYSNWLVATQDNVHGIDTLTLPGGGEHEKVFNGRVFLGEAWIEQ